MTRRWQFLLWLALAWPGHSQTYTRQNIATILGFENNARAGTNPAGWVTNTIAGIVSDNQIVHSGKYSARFDRTASSSQAFSTISQSIPIDFGGTTIQWRGWIKMQSVGDYIALWASSPWLKSGARGFRWWPKQNHIKMFLWRWALVNTGSAKSGFG